MGPHRPFFGIQEAYRPLLLPDQLVAERARNLGQLGDEPEVAETDHGGTKGVEQPPEPVVLGFVAPIAMCGSVGGSVGTSAVQSGMDVVQRSSFTLTNRLHASGHAGSVPYLGMSLKCTFIYMGRDSNDFVGCVRFQHHPQLGFRGIPLVLFHAPLFTVMYVESTVIWRSMVCDKLDGHLFLPVHTKNATRRICFNSKYRVYFLLYLRT